MRPARPRIGRAQVASIVLACILLGLVAVWSNVFGVSDRLHGLAHRIELFVDPPPDRPIAAIVRVTPRPTDGPSMAPSVEPASPAGTAEAGSPQPTATPAPQRVSVDVNLLKHPEKAFISEEYDHTWCAVAGTQMVLGMWGKAPLTLAFQKELASRIGEWESRRDSLNGGWGPAAIVAALKAYGVPGYEVRAYDTRADALSDAARAIEKEHAPVLLLAWRGAHTWVMTGFRADADPLVFDDAKVLGTYILDPWYPLISSIWPRSMPPGAYHNLDVMRVNYLRWKRPEGHYKDRDGLFIAVVPTQPLAR
jgi:Peptidase_C39 like family